MALGINFHIPPDDAHKTFKDHARTCWKNTSIVVVGVGIISALSATFLTIAIANPNLLHLKGTVAKAVQGTLGIVLGGSLIFLGAKGIQKIIGNVSVSDEADWEKFYKALKNDPLFSEKMIFSSIYKQFEDYQKSSRPGV